MKQPMPSRMGFLALAICAALVGSCVKKPQVPPPTEAVPPPQPAAQPPAPAPRDTTPVPTPPRLSSSDFEPAFFDFDSYTLRADARQALDHDAKLLRDNADAGVVIEGHCDERGTAEYNQALGEKRAQAARDYLVAAGIPASRFEVVSYGKERPFDPGHDESAWQKNRRAHILLK